MDQAQEITHATALNLTTVVKEMHELQSSLDQHLATSKKTENELRAEIRSRRAIIEMSADGIDHQKIELARTMLTVRGAYANGGEDRESVVRDAIKQLATGIPIRERYGDLWRVQFGTKSYAHWYGQRCDNEYGYGPRHGSLIFSVGLKSEIRKHKKHSDLTPEEVEACVYYLINLERVQRAEMEAAA